MPPMLLLALQFSLLEARLPPHPRGAVLPEPSTKAQQALAEQREAMKRESAQARSQRRADEAEARFEQRKLKRKQKHRGH